MAELPEPSGTPSGAHVAEDDGSTAQVDRGVPAPRRWVPTAVQGAALWSGRILLIGAVVYFATLVAVRLGLVVLALLVGLLVTALLRPVAEWLHRLGLPRLAATWLVLLGLLAVTAAALFFVVQRAAAQVQMLRSNIGSGLERLRQMLVDTFGLSDQQVTGMTQRVIDQLRGSFDPGRDSFTFPVMQSTAVITAVLAAVGLALFTAFWLIYDGGRVWRFVVGLVPEPHRVAVNEAGERAWSTLGGYLRGVTIVALIDAVGIGIALVVLDVPLALALALLTFIGGYVPLVGATVAGMAAVLVALAAQGPTTALLTLGAVLLVQQIEGQVLAPLIMGRSVALHPLAVAYAITIGGVLYGLAGAVIAVPLTAVAYAIGASLSGRRDLAELPRRRRPRRREAAQRHGKTTPSPVDDDRAKSPMEVTGS